MKTNPYNSKLSYERYSKNKEYFDLGLIEALEEQQRIIQKQKSQALIYQATIASKNDTIRSMRIKIEDAKIQIKALKYQLKEKDQDIEATLKIINGEIERIKREVDEELQKSYRDNNKLHQENERLKQEINRYKKRNKKLSSSNSSQAPSIDNNRPVSLREKSELKRGGQKGHRGSFSKLSKEVSEVINKRVKAAPSGAEAVTDSAGKVLHYRTQEIDIRFEAKIIETRYYIDETGEELSQKEKSKYAINPVVYSDHTKAVTIYLHQKGGIALKRLSTMISEISDKAINIKEGTIVNWNKELAVKSKTETTRILADIVKDEVIGVDETGWRVNGKAAWMHTITSDHSAYFLVSGKRSDKENGVIGLLKEYPGKLVHDHFKPYYWLEDCEHVECNAHVMRYLKAGFEFDDSIDCEKMIIFLRKALRIKNELLVQNINQLKEDEYIELEAEYKSILETGLNKYKKNNPKMARKYLPDYIKLFERLLEYKDAHLLFLKDFKVPFDNNDAERQMRVVKSKKKISGQSDSIITANYYASFLTISQTCLKQGKNTLKTIEDLLAS